MIALKEIEKQDFQFVGQGAKPDFIVSSRTDSGSFKNMRFSKHIDKLLNDKLSIKNYSVESVKHITFIFNALSPDRKGVNWIEKQEYIKKNKQYRLEIKFPNYQQFISATKQEALSMMAAETLRGAKKFLADVTDFKFEAFYADLEKLFEEHGLV